MITEYPLEHRRYDHSEYEPFWAAAAALDLPLSLHTATRRQGRIRGAGDKTLRDASSPLLRQRRRAALHNPHGPPSC
jgi:predicted TIM-barrel fold metal-dependent hydrolase